MLTKKDYIQLARIVNGGTIYHNECYINKQSFTESLVNWLANDNPKFDKERFKNACYGRDKTPLSQ